MRTMHIENQELHAYFRARPEKRTSRATSETTFTPPLLSGPKGAARVATAYFSNRNHKERRRPPVSSFSRAERATGPPQLPGWDMGSAPHTAWHAPAPLATKRTLVPSMRRWKFHRHVSASAAFLPRLSLVPNTRAPGTFKPATRRHSILRSMERRDAGKADARRLTLAPNPEPGLHRRTAVQPASDCEHFFKHRGTKASQPTASPVHPKDSRAATLATATSTLKASGDPPPAQRLHWHACRVRSGQACERTCKRINPRLGPTPGHHLPLRRWRSLLPARVPQQVAASPGSSKTRQSKEARGARPTNARSARTSPQSQST